ncbi:MAG: flagellar hook-basal body protein [Butyrivibrio sp.]|jgi:flagellar basal-body rod protein FlgG|uniref:flagellar hook-basal body protein n=1 Tax=Butyrivibrio sp. NC2002 TaxID=1410610 RepID=UPI00055F1E86|nr:flagellar hook-basal body protein [Butyrivibrio sp. NC2002]MBE5858602.1 flagellar hook-basal body protein [Butyrivibrio sp.]
MVRSLWTAASGMNAQQTNVDTIANNLANVNSAGYKAQSAKFKSLLYQELKTKTVQTTGSPVNSDVGLGVRVSSINQYFTQGSLQDNDSSSAFAIQGDGFFAYSTDATTINEANTRYTRNGNFVWALTEAGALELTTSEGNPVLGIDGNVITVNSNVVKATDIICDQEGALYYLDQNQNRVDIGQIALFQFRNPEGLERTGDTSFSVTPASGDPLPEATTAGITRSVIVQGYLEGSNVNVATEMVNLIVAQRAYEMNSTAITTTDEMMQTANGLKR